MHSKFTAFGVSEARVQTWVKNFQRSIKHELKEALLGS